MTPLLAGAILLVEDNSADARLVMEYAREGLPGASIERVERFSDAAAVLSAPDAAFDMVLLGLPEGAGADAVSELVQAFPAISVVVLTGASDEGRAYSAWSIFL